MSTPVLAATRRALAGLFFSLAGSGALTLIIILAYDGAPEHRMMLVALGIPLTLLISALAQISVVVGLALLWSAVHHGR